MRLSGIARQPKLFTPRRRRSLRVRCTLTEGKEPVLETKTRDDIKKNRQKNKRTGPPFKVVITGSTKGIGLELAREFLNAGDDVVISSRYESNVQPVVETLRSEYGDSNTITGITCDVSKQKEVADLADYCRDELGGVNFWINNAGCNGYQYNVLTEFQEEDLKQILETNILGVMLACKEAIRVMRDQDINGHILNMDGAGANGRPTPRFAAYGATKRAINQFNESLCEELKLLNIKNIGVHNISPGMCTTDLLMSGVDTAQAKFFINCLAEPPSVPAKHLVPLVRKLPLKSKTAGVVSQNLVYLTPVKAYSQILKRFVFKERKDRFIKEE